MTRQVGHLELKSPFGKNELKNNNREPDETRGPTRMAFVDMCPPEWQQKQQQQQHEDELEVHFRSKDDATLPAPPVQFRSSGGGGSSRHVKLWSSSSTNASGGGTTKGGTNDKSVTFKFKEMIESEKPGLSALFPVTWIPGMKEYLIISDQESDDDDSETENGIKRDRKAKVGATSTSDEQQQTPTSPEASPVASSSESEDNDDDEVMVTTTTTTPASKVDRSFKEKFSLWTKDLFTSPSHNLREFLRRREGYLPPQAQPRGVVSSRKKSDEQQ